MIRKPVVAGMFYPGDKKELNSMVDGLLEEAMMKVGALRRYRGIIVPHAGYVYSGRTQSYAYTAEIPNKAIILGVNHRGQGEPVALFGQGEWEVPNGSLKCDDEMANFLMAEAPLLKEDASSHEEEHSIEVQLPFLVRKNPSVLITPISMYDYRIETCGELGRAVSKALEKFPDTIVIASSDFTHYEEKSFAEKQDALAGEKILNMDAVGLSEVVAKKKISMCGLGPVATLLFALAEGHPLGLKEGAARKIFYETSAASSGDYSSVVGYTAYGIE